ncbi:MAG: hypothetical protein R2715_22355 [Ilumatobacteraceae bacterium]
MLVLLKAGAMNLLSIGAAYGITVAIFQWGWGRELIGVDKAARSKRGFRCLSSPSCSGSMDYEVFSSPGSAEEYDRTGDNASGCRRWPQATARVITAAALIMFFVFSAFVLGDDHHS